MSNLGKSILIEDENHTIVLVNSDFCHMFQIPLQPSQLVGVNCLDSLDRSLSLFQDPEDVRKGIMEKYGKREAMIGEELLMADGRIFERDYIPVIIENEFKGQLWSYVDVTPKRELQKSLIDARNQAIASEKAKSAFLSSMSHEIRTPMNAILGLAEQLTMTPLNEQQKFFLDHITESAGGLLGIINDVLDLSKIEAGKMKIGNEVISLYKINKSVENILRPKAEEKGLLFRTEIDRFINQGETYLFFFHFNGFIGDRHIISMRKGCAGFFTDKEVKDSGGIILTAEETAQIPGTLTPAIS
jgi:signal transduction histidine kinase